MKKLNNKYIPEVGKCFHYKNEYRFVVYENQLEEIEEVEINDDVREVISNHFILDNKFELILNENLKKNLVNQIFSNDDQIAIMLNYQDSKTVKNKEMYNLMQGWRNWFSEIITKIKNM